MEDSTGERSHGAKRATWCVPIVEAGFSKIHLDASMRCADERELTEATIAERGGGAVRSRRGGARRPRPRLRHRHRGSDSGRRTERSIRWR